MNNFLENVRKNTNTAYTANGAKSNAHTLSHLLELFSKGGAMRGQQKEFLELFKMAFAEDSTYALRILFYLRDVRGGQGERDLFRVGLKYLADNQPLIGEVAVQYVSEYGRWDDLLVLLDSEIGTTVSDYLKKQINKDIELKEKGKPVSLLAKWLPSVNTSSKATRALAHKLIKAWGTSPKRYRRDLSSLRKYINVTEVKMSSGQWEAIEYSKVPSYASKNYRKAFTKHDEERYNQFIADVLEGKENIKAATLYPYDIVKNVMYTPDATMDAQWKNLPDYMKEPEDSLVVVDVSGSMESGKGNVRPIHVAISLGIYMAERNKGVFKDYFMTFSERPQIVKLLGDTIYQKVNFLKKADWGYNTDLQAVFGTLLQTAVDNETPREDMPKKLYIISDMQFDRAVHNNGVTNFEAIQKVYDRYGYEMPQLVFWNVNAHSDTPVTKDEKGTFLVSGASPSILKHAINCEATNPLDLMYEVLDSDRYRRINIR